jgi:anti-sigma regulatory factor (Ser/Thr protein kinase)
MRSVTPSLPLEEGLRLAPEAASIATARRAMAEIARDVGAPEGDVKLAVSEAVTNAVTHAFRGRNPGTITLSASHQGGRLQITVADDGIGMTPNLESTGLGFGVPLITKIANEVRFDSSELGTTVVMAFDTTPEGKAV